MIENVTIGSDPEFVFEDKNGHMLESYILLQPVRLAVCGQGPRPRCDICNSRTLFCGHGRNSPEIGSDGNLGEIRPKPGRNPLEHVENIQKLFHAINFLPPGAVIKGGTVHHDCAIGGHIHIGMHIEDKGHCAKWLSHYAGIPMRKIERPSDLPKRGLSMTSFGRFGGYDTKDYGLEWRMPASWLVTKEIATACLSLAYVVAQNYDPTYVPMLKAQYLQSLKEDISPMLEFIEKMEGYEVYRKQIAPLFHMIETRQVWNVHQNVLDTWK